MTRFNQLGKLMGWEFCLSWERALRSTRFRRGMIRYKPSVQLRMLS